METGILRRLRHQDGLLMAALARVEALAGRPRDSRLSAALTELGGRLHAHTVVSEELVLRWLRECPGPWLAASADLECEHVHLRTAFESELEWEPRPRREALTDFARSLRRHLGRELALLHQVGDASRARLARLPLWRVEELYERAAHLAETWPEKWLG